MNIAPSSIDAHDEIELLLPWYVNGTLKADERQRVDAHLQQCGDCRAALLAEQQIRDHVRAPTDDVPPSALGLARLQRRIASEQASVGEETRPTRRATWRRSLIATAAAAGLAAVLIPMTLLRHTEVAPDFHTLSSAPADATVPKGNDVRIAFAPTATERDIATALASFDGVVLSGPNSAGAYTVRLQGVAERPDAVQSAVIALRKVATVEFAEPIAPAGAP